MKTDDSIKVDNFLSKALEKHPCFSRDASMEYGRVHLPIAPNCNIQCKYCNRKYDCPNENRPGVTSEVMTPERALLYLSRILKEKPYISVVGIAGPGDAFARPRQTLDILKRVRQKYPKMLLCVSTNGLNVLPYIDELAALQVSHVTITVNAVNPKVGARIYDWVKDGKSLLEGRKAAVKLWEKQREAIIALKAGGIKVKINTVLIKGINDGHIEDIAIEMTSLGVDLMNCMSLIPVEGTEFENWPAAEGILLGNIRAKVRKYLPQMYHCTRCRADASGFLGDCSGIDVKKSAKKRAASK